MRASDFRSVIFVLLTIAFLILPFHFYKHLSNLASFCALFAANFALVFSCCAINHNHLHCPTFKSAALNRFFDLLLTVARGHTTRTIIVPHNYNHHLHCGSEKDWIRPELAGTGFLPVRISRYVWRASREMAIQRRSADAPKLNFSEEQDYRFEQIILLIFMGFLFYQDILLALLFVVLPWIGSMAALLAINYFQHEGCDPNSEMNHSRNFTGRISNWFLFNSGYHTAHHLFPGRHWSELPALHQVYVVLGAREDLRLQSFFDFIFGTKESSRRWSSAGL
jgi:fatty acid desaturase